jgi:uridine monophosphate synthetase
LVESFFSTLENRINAIDSLLCVGLDPHQDDLDEYNGQTVRDFCLRLIEQTADVAAAYKPNGAFFEALGGEGMVALEDVIRQIPDGIPVILDVKRGDISSSARAYAKAAFDILKADAVTLNPYLGKDAVMPFIENPAKGAFILCKTSNPTSKEIQDLMVSEKIPSQTSLDINRPLYEWIADLVRQWNVQGSEAIGSQYLHTCTRDWSSRGKSPGCFGCRSAGRWPGYVNPGITVDIKSR